MDEFQQGLIDALNRFAAVAEILVRAVEHGAGSSKAGKKKKDAMTVRGVMTKFHGPNQYKFYDCVIDGHKYSTRKKEFADVLERAWSADAIVEISYTVKKNESPKDGKIYENRYIESVEIVTSTIVSDGVNQPKPQMPPDEDQEESPF